MAAKRRRLTDANVARLAPAAREYTVLDTRHAGLGVRVRPSGHRSFVYCPKGDDGVRRTTLGSAALTSVEEARRRCLAIETGARPDRTERDPVPTFAEFVAGPVRVRLDRCKPSTKRSERSALRARLLPTFASLPLDRITRAVVTRWFDEYSRTAPGGANSALSLLRRILNHAVDCGHLQVNPARGVKPNPRPKLTRFLSREELRRLHHELDHCVGSQPSRVQQARHHPPSVADRLSEERGRDHALAGHRRGHTLNLVDAKAGPRRVFLNAPARTILERQPRSERRLCLSFTARPGPGAVLKSAALVLGAQKSRDRGRTSA